MSDDRERLGVYLSTLMPSLPPALGALEESARERKIPILRKDSQNLLRLLLAMQEPEEILEVGTAKLGFSDRITLIRGDAAETLATLSGPYDFVFLDAAKGQYPHYFSEIKRLMPAGSLLVTDNCLQEGLTIESRYFVKRRDRTIHGRVRDFLYQLCHDGDFVSDMIDSGDGVLVSRKVK